MQEIKCPKCGEVFQVDESGYAAIVKQVRDKEFSKEVQQEKDNAVKIAVADVEKDKDKIIAELQQKLAVAEMEKEAALRDVEAEGKKLLSEKDNEIIKLRSQIEIDKTNSELQIKEATIAKDKEITDLSIPFRRTERREPCQLCDFKAICGR